MSQTISFTHVAEELNIGKGIYNIHGNTEKTRIV